MDTIALDRRQKWFNWVLALAILTVVYNIIEGLVAMYFGLKDETLALFGFGVDSFIETISALGVTQMVLRIKRNPDSHKGPFEVRALKITGWCFYALAVALTVSAIYNLIQGHQPVSTLAGTVIAGISILTMWALVRAKIYFGKKLHSEPVIADAKCNLVCIYMSIILLVSSGLWWLFKIPHVDSLGALALVYFSWKEGRESFQKAKGIECCSC